MQTTVKSELLSIGEASLLLGVHPDTLKRWEKAGRISSVRIGELRHRRFRRADVVKLLEA